VLVDEAYHHYAESAEYESVVPLIASHRQLIVARTFSKIYGMAGLRAGFTVARPELLQKMTVWNTGAMPAPAMAAAHAALAETELIAARKAANAKRRADLMSFFDAHGFRYTPSVANHLMVDTRLPTVEVIDGLKQRGVYIGRPWPVWPTHVRVSIGNEADMARFKRAFLEVVARG
jgi:histidinol-phosphate/aromatic aminotransferase/cobyric acid decarboxylase-like protein